MRNFTLSTTGKILLTVPDARDFFSQYRAATKKTVIFMEWSFVDESIVSVLFTQQEQPKKKARMKKEEDDEEKRIKLEFTEQFKPVQMHGPKPPTIPKKHAGSACIRTAPPAKPAFTQRAEPVVEEQRKDDQRGNLRCDGCGRSGKKIPLSQACSELETITLLHLRPRQLIKRERVFNYDAVSGTRNTCFLMNFSQFRTLYIPNIYQIGQSTANLCHHCYCWIYHCGQHPSVESICKFAWPALVGHELRHNKDMDKVKFIF